MLLIGDRSYARGSVHRGSVVRLFCALCLAAFAPALAAAELRDVRVWDGPEATRIVFDFDGSVRHKVFTLANPDRLVVDFGKLDKGARQMVERAQASGLVKSVRTGSRDGGGVRVVLDLAQAARPKSFELAPEGGSGYRLVVDLFGPTPTLAQIAEPAGADGTSSRKMPSTTLARPAAATDASPADSAAVMGRPPVSGSTAATGAALLPIPERKDQPKLGFVAPKAIVVAIDAGHGGQDPGARGRSGLLEKDVALSVAKRLAKMINGAPGYKAVLTRDGDYYIGLRERTERARKAEADLFVSIHANAYKDRALRGSAVYVLSPRGATSEHARWLANQENSSDMVGGIGINDKDPALAAVLIDLSQTSTLEASFDVGNRMLSSLSQFNRLQKPDVQQAAFVVLKSPDIPSVLVETAFITNDHDEKLLKQSSYQDRLARSLFDGIRGYFANYRPQQQIASAPEPLQDESPRAVPVSLRRGAAATPTRSLVH